MATQLYYIYGLTNPVLKTHFKDNGQEPFATPFYIGRTQYRGARFTQHLQMGNDPKSKHVEMLSNFHTEAVMQIYAKFTSNSELWAEQYEYVWIRCVGRGFKLTNQVIGTWSLEPFEEWLEFISLLGNMHPICREFVMLNLKASPDWAIFAKSLTWNLRKKYAPNLVSHKFPMRWQSMTPPINEAARWASDLMEYGYAKTEDDIEATRNAWWCKTDEMPPRPAKGNYKDWESRYSPKQDNP